MAIDHNGRVLGWKFGRKKGSEEIREVLTQVGQHMPNWHIVIGDGAKPYAMAVRSLRKRAYLIQQFHTHPWERVRITEFTPTGTHLIFENKSIVSNRIESLNSEFKLIIPNRGMHNENHILNRIKRLVQLKSAMTITSSSRMKLPVSARVGFNNLLHFFDPDPSQIEFRKSR